MYAKRVEFDFNVCGQRIAITDFATDFVRVEDTRKNGQEDCHIYGTLVQDERGFFDWCESEGETFSEYDSQELADAIRDYINENGLPV